MVEFPEIEATSQSVLDTFTRLQEQGHIAYTPILDAAAREVLEVLPFPSVFDLFTTQVRTVMSEDGRSHFAYFFQQDKPGRALPDPEDIKAAAANKPHVIRRIFSRLFSSGEEPKTEQPASLGEPYLVVGGAVLYTLGNHERGREGGFAAVMRFAPIDDNQWQDYPDPAKKIVGSLSLPFVPFPLDPETRLALVYPLTSYPPEELQGELIANVLRDSIRELPPHLNYSQAWRNYLENNYKRIPLGARWAISAGLTELERSKQHSR